MKTVLQSIAMLVLGVFVLTSCQPETVSPKSESGSAPEMQAQNVVHPELYPVCGESDQMALVGEDGSLQVNDCGFLPCGTNEPAWGTAKIMHGLDLQEDLAFAINLSLAFQWMAMEVDVKIDAPNNFSYLNGIPVVDPSWHHRAINPVVNQYQFRVPAAAVEGCKTVACRIKIAKFSFFGGLDANTERYVWLRNDQYSSLQAAPNHFLMPYCVSNCLAAPSFDPSGQCAAAPAIPTPNCTQTKSGGGININSSNDVICVSGGTNIGNVNFNGAGTLIIDNGVTVSGGINANNGGTVIVKGTFNWNSSANINGNFKLYVAENGTLNRSGDLTMNNQNNLLVNLGTVNINNNLTYVGTVHNAGALYAQGLNVNSSNTQFINSGFAKFNGFANINSNTRFDNCGTFDVGNNLQMNSQSLVNNYCTILARGYAHANGEYHNYALMISGLSGNGDGLNIQGDSYLHDGSRIVTKNLYWSNNRPLRIDGEAAILLANSTLDQDDNLSEMSGQGKMRFNNGVQLHGNGTLTIADNDPNSQGDNPRGNWTVWPTTWENYVNAQSGAEVIFRQLDTENDMPAACDY